jgi:hypothetical protein
MNNLQILHAVLGSDHVTADLEARIGPVIDRISPGGVLASSNGRTIRLATSGDAAGLRAMTLSPGDATGPMVLPEVPFPGHLHVVMTEQDRIVGDMVGHGATTGKAKTNIQFWLDNAFVDANDRRKGFGRMMGHAVLQLVEGIREEAGLARLGHPEGMTDVSGEADPASAGENLIFDMDIYANDLADASVERFENAEAAPLSYIVADEEADLWGHLFQDADGETRERNCRFVFDVEEETMIHVEVFQDNAWNTASEDERADVEDSLKNGNPEAIDVPFLLGLRVTNDLPDWIMNTPAPGM